MDVKTLKPHGNPHGDAYWKKEGDTYSLPDDQAAGLIRSGLVKEARKPLAAKEAEGGADKD